MSDSKLGKQIQRVLKFLHARKKDNLVSVNSAELSAYSPRDAQPHSAPEEHVPPIHRIPYEILLHIIHIYVKDSAYPVRDLSALTLVCQRWRAIVEDAGFLWGRIDASEGLAAVRKGLRMAKDAALHITYDQWRSKTNQLAFFKAIGERLSQWRSLVMKARDGAHCSPILETTVPPRLEKLHLSAHPYSWERTSDEPLILFGGAAAPPGLKDVHLVYIPIAVAPLKLACLTSLHLNGIHDLAMPELLRILGESPALETLTLRFMKDLVPITALNLPPGWTIQLPSLSHLFLVNLSVPFTHFFLSALAAPWLQKLHVNCNMKGTPSSQLLNDDLFRLVPPLKSLASTANAIGVTVGWESRYKIVVGGLEIALEPFGFTPIGHFQDSFEWLCNHLGGYLNNLPFHLRIDACKSSFAYLEWFTSRVVVTELSLWSSGTWNFRTRTKETVRLLSYPIPSSSTSWFLPDVEVLVSNLVWEGSHPEIVEMIERRHSANREQREGGSGVPRKFKEIRLSCGMPLPLRPNVVFLEAVETAGEGAEVYWEGKKWTSVGLDK